MKKGFLLFFVFVFLFSTCFVSAAFDYTLTTTPLAVAKGNTITTDVRVTKTAGTSEFVSITVSNLPTGISFVSMTGNSAWGCNPGNSGCTMKITYAVSSSANLGLQTVTVNGVSTGGISKTTLQSFTVAQNSFPFLWKEFMGTSTVSSVSFSGDGSKVVSGSFGKNIKIFRVSDGVVLKSIDSANGVSVRDVAFSPDGTKILSGGGDGYVKLWDANTGSNIRTISGNNLPILSVAFSPDGTKMAAGGEDNQVRIWNVNDGSLLRTINYTNFVNAIEFSKDSSKIAVASNDWTAKVYSVSSGTVLNGIQFVDAVRDVAFSPDGTKMAAVGLDFTLRIINLNTNQILTFPGFPDGVYSVAYSSDGKILSTSDMDGNIVFRDANTNAVLGSFVNNLVTAQLEYTLLGK